TATSTVALVRELGVTVGAAALGGLLASRLLGGLGTLSYLAGLSPEQLRAAPDASRHAYAQAYVSAIGPLFGGLAVLFLGALAVSFLLPDRRLGESVRAEDGVRAAGRGPPPGVVALDGRQRRPRGHPARPGVAAPRRRPRRADVQRRHGHAARRPRVRAPGIARVAGRRPARC